jgi:hypothetical protein
LAQEPLIDFVDSEDRDDIQQGASMVPRRLALEHFRRPLENLRRLIADIKREGAALVAVLGTPPPRRDYMTALDDFRANPLFQNFARQRGMDITRVSPTPARTMLKLWRVLQEAMEGIAASEGALFIPVSAEMFGPDGHLAERYRGAVEDFTHANREYGDLMLERAVRAANAEAKRGSSV